MNSVCGLCKYRVDGQCRRFPPQLIEITTPGVVHDTRELQSTWLMVSADHPQCGEYEERVEAIKRSETY